MAGRPSYLDPSATVTETEAKRRRKELAEFIVRGVPRKHIAEHFGVHHDTITTWAQRPDVRSLVTSLGRARGERILHKIDSELEERLKKIKDMELEDVIKLRKEMAPRQLEISEKGEETTAVQEMMHELFEQVEQDAREAASNTPSPSRR